MSQPQTVISWIRRYIRRRRLPVALFLAIAASLILTGVSVSIYSLGGFSRFDLSRPDYEKERNQLSTAPPQKTYDVTSPIDQRAADEFLSEFDGRLNDLHAYGNFRDGGLSDEELQLVDAVPGSLQ